MKSLGSPCNCTRLRLSFNAKCPETPVLNWLHAKADHLNEELGCLKLFFAAFLAIAMLVVAWLVQNYLSVDSAIIVGAFIVISVVTYLLVWIIRYVYKRIEQLGDF